jgi:hypothetical protein
MTGPFYEVDYVTYSFFCSIFADVIGTGPQYYNAILRHVFVDIGI